MATALPMRAKRVALVQFLAPDGLGLAGIVSLRTCHAAPVAANGSTLVQEAVCPRCGCWSRYLGACVFSCRCGPFLRGETLLTRQYDPRDRGEDGMSWQGQRRGLPAGSPGGSA